MNVWQPPYRISVLKSDTLAVQALTMALENNKNWEIVYTQSFWESCLLAVNCGLHVLFLNESLAASDMTLETFDQARFFACRQFPIPFLLVKSNSELNDSNMSYPLMRKIKSTGIINRLKIELSEIASEMTTNNSFFSKYTEFQFLSFVRGHYEKPGAILEGAFPNNYLIYGQVECYLKENKPQDALNLISNFLIQQPLNPFFQISAACIYYHMNKLEEARDKLNSLANRNNFNPFLLYLIHNIVDVYHDYPIQYAIVRMLEEKFPSSYLSQLTSAIWNSRMGHKELAITQFLSCLEKLPQDFIAATELAKLFKNKKYMGLMSGVKNLSSAYLPKASMGQSLYADLLNLKGI